MERANDKKSRILKACIAVTLCGVIVSLIPYLRKASDMAAAATFPDSMVSTSFMEANAAGEPYLIKCATKANKIILYLHTWSTNYQQVMQFPEFHGIDRACIVSPNFNGPNSTPLSLGSDDALQRIDLVLREVMYKTGLSRVYIVAASGGTLAAMDYMGKYPGKVHRASLWLPIYDLALLYMTTADGTLKVDMVSALGAPPSGPEDPIYFERSPRSRLNACAGPTKVFINVGLSDTTSIPQHGVMARDHISRGPDCEVLYKEWPIGHVFGVDQRIEAVKQLILE